MVACATVIISTD